MSKEKYEFLSCLKHTGTLKYDALNMDLPYVGENESSRKVVDILIFPYCSYSS